MNVNYHKYYDVADGECSLDNPIVWIKLRKYVYSVIKNTHYINNKSFVDANDILIEVKSQLKPSDILQGVNSGYEPISVICKKIATQIGREWWKYLKKNQPEYFKKLRLIQREWIKNNKHRCKDKINNSNKKVQKKNRDALSDNYILMCVYNNLKYQTGISYTFDEIREQFPYLIKEKREKILKLRSRKSI